MKDTPKRRREVNQCRVTKITKAKRVKHESRDDTPESNSSMPEDVDERLEAANNTVSALQTVSTLI